MLRVALEGRSLPACTGAGGTVGQPESAAAHCGCHSVASRYALGADGVGAARPGARGSRVTASLYALGAEGGGLAGWLGCWLGCGWPGCSSRRLLDRPAFS